MRKPNVIQVTAGLTITMSVSANVWYGIDMWERGGAQLIVVGVWMPIILVLLERVLHASSAGRVFKFMLGVVAAGAIAYSMSHLAHLATPAGANLWEQISAWIFAATVDIAMVLAGWALLKNMAPATPEPQVIEKIMEKIVEVQVPVEVEKVVYVEVPAKPASAQHEEERVETEETEVIERVTRTRRSSSHRIKGNPELYAQVVELIRDTDLKPVEILRKLEIEGQPNQITRDLPEWKQYRVNA